MHDDKLMICTTRPIMFCVYLAGIDKGGPYGLSATVAFVAPLQGFNNFLVYIRQVILKKIRMVAFG